ncbi:plasmid protein [Xylella taiwanensis]|nr:plasmid protein [Xylella taiwanensis]
MLLLVTIAMMILTGCKKENSGRKEEPVRTVKWFKKHKTERKAQLAECRSNPSELAITPNCANASDADN